MPNPLDAPGGRQENHISVHPPGRPAQEQELYDTAIDWQRRFHAMKSQCEARGFSVRYGEDGMPVVEAPKHEDQR